MRRRDADYADIHLLKEDDLRNLCSIPYLEMAIRCKVLHECMYHLRNLRACPPQAQQKDTVENKCESNSPR